MTSRASKTKAIPSLGVDWHLPKPDGGFYRRRFATTTVASSDLIALLAADGMTWRQVAHEIRYDPEAKAVALAFVDAGHGEVLARTMIAPIRSAPAPAVDAA